VPLSFAFHEPALVEADSRENRANVSRLSKAQRSPAIERSAPVSSTLNIRARLAAKAEVPMQFAGSIKESALP
jgi:hypothetical protein